MPKQIGLVGVMVMLTSVALVTSSAAEPDNPLPACVAVTVVDPAAAAVAYPLDPAALLNDAIPPGEVDQVTCSVISRVVESEKVPMAEY